MSPNLLPVLGSRLSLKCGLYLLLTHGLSCLMPFGPRPAPSADMQIQGLATLFPFANLSLPVIGFSSRTVFPSFGHPHKIKWIE